MRLYGPGRRFLGLGELDTHGRLLPKRLVATSQSASSAVPRANCNVLKLLEKAASYGLK